MPFHNFLIFSSWVDKPIAQKAGGDGKRWMPLRVSLMTL
jgi:hypothetical protein